MSLNELHSGSFKPEIMKKLMNDSLCFVVYVRIRHVVGTNDTLAPIP